MEFLFLTILNMSLTGTFVIAAICLARLLLKKVPKIISYCLWAVAGFRLVFPFAIESVWSLVPFRTQPIPRVQEVSSPAIPEMGTASQQSISSAVGGGAYPSLSPPPEIGAVVVPDGLTAPLVSADTLQIFISIGAAIWLIGFAFMLFRAVVSYLRLRHRMRGSVHLYENVYEVAQIPSPFVFGFFSPKIYLPRGLSRQEQEYIVLHEQTHIRRRDHILKFAAYFIVCLHWFNPLVRVGFRFMSTDMEMSCDESVLRHLGSETKTDYSRILLMLASDRRVLAGAPLAFGESAVTERVKNILKFKRTHKILSVIAAVLVLTLGVGLALSQTDGASAEEPAASAFTLPDHGEFVPPVFTIQDRSDSRYEPCEDSLTIEEAANLGAQYLWEMFGACIDGTEIRMMYSISSESAAEPETTSFFAHPERTQAEWIGEVFADQYARGHEHLFRFRIDAFSGASTELHRAFQVPEDPNMRALTAEEIERGQQAAMAYVGLLFHHRGTESQSVALADHPAMQIFVGDYDLQYFAGFWVMDNSDRIAHISLALDSETPVTMRLYLNEDLSDWFPPSDYLIESVILPDEFEPSADAIPREEAAELGIYYIRELFGFELDAASVQMRYLPESTGVFSEEIPWISSVWQGSAHPFEFQIDALTGEPLTLIWARWCDTDLSEIEAQYGTPDPFTRLLSPEERLHYIQVAMDHAQAMFDHRGMTVSGAELDHVPAVTMIFERDEEGNLFAAAHMIGVHVSTLCGSWAWVTVVLDTEELVLIQSYYHAFV